MRALTGGPESQKTQLRKRLSLDTKDPLVDEIIHERYRVEGKVGSGGMGNVFLAFDSERGGYVALKMIGDGVVPGSDAEKRLELEAEATMKISHENVVDVLDIGRVRGKLFLVMEFLEGIDLKEEIRQKGRMEWPQVRHVIEKVCDALDAAHGYKEYREDIEVPMPILHRDLKPENIFLVSNGELPHVKLIDFGLAKIMSENKSESKRELTSKDIAVGSPSYMAPEKLTVRNYDHRADLYSLGITIYEMLTGRPPFTSDAENWDVQVLLKHINEKPRRLSDARPGLVLPPGVEDAIMKALEKDPSKRYQSAMEMKEAILGRSSMRPKTTEPPRSSRMQAEREVTVEITEIEEIAAMEKSREIPVKVSSRSIKIPEPIEDPDRMEYLPTGKQGSRIGRFIRNLTIAGLIGAAGYYAYTNREKIEKFFEHEAPPPPSAQNAPAVQSAPTTFELRIGARSGSEEVRGASVYDITDGRRNRVYLGSTPLDAYLQRGQRTVLIVARGYAEATLSVSPEAPTHTVSLRRPRPRVDSSANTVPTEEESLEPAPDQSLP